MRDLAAYDNIILVWLISALVAEAVYYFTSKRSGLDRRLGKFRIWTVFYIILVFLSYSYISTSHWDSIHLAGDKPVEVVLQELVDNQQKLRVELHRFKEVLSFLLLMTVFYLMFAAGVPQQWRTEHISPSAPPADPRPLGLDLE